MAEKHETILKTIENDDNEVERLFDRLVAHGRPETEARDLANEYARKLYHTRPKRLAAAIQDGRAIEGD